LRGAAGSKNLSGVNMKIIECVPNFSEGCDSRTITAIAAVFKSFPDVQLADFSGDADHNRSVFTFWESRRMCLLRRLLPAVKLWS
jgi:glutamate formiminotransferase